MPKTNGLSRVPIVRDDTITQLRDRAALVAALLDQHWLTTKQVAVIAQTSESFIREQIRADRLKATKVGKLIRVTPIAVRRWLDGEGVEPPP